MSSKIRILLIDDHSLFRESLGRLLEAEPDFEIAGSYSSIVDALAAPGRDADIVLLDYNLGEEHGLKCVESFIKESSGSHVLIVTGGMSDAETVLALKCGVSGIFLKHSPPRQLVEAIYSATRGEIWLDTRCIRALVAGVTGGEALEKKTSAALTSRERAVLARLFQGLTNKEIAGELKITENAVKWTLQQLYEKTGARVRSQLVRIILEKYGKDWLKTVSNIADG